jgi:FixJ family two-component response regulator
MQSAPPAHVRPLLLLIEDDPAVLGALTFAFDTEGYRVAAFRDATTVLAAPHVDEPACIVVDHRLPGLSGLQVLSQLRARGVTAPALLITTHPNAALRREAAAAHVEIVEKPLLGDVLAAKVRALSAKHSSGGHSLAPAPTSPEEEL